MLFREGDVWRLLEKNMIRVDIAMNEKSLPVNQEYKNLHRNLIKIYGCLSV